MIRGYCDAHGVRDRRRRRCAPRRSNGRPRAAPARAGSPGSSSPILRDVRACASSLPRRCPGPGPRRWRTALRGSICEKMMPRGRAAARIISETASGRRCRSPAAPRSAGRPGCRRGPSADGWPRLTCRPSGHVSLVDVGVDRSAGRRHGGPPRFGTWSVSRGDRGHGAGGGGLDRGAGAAAMSMPSFWPLAVFADDAALRPAWHRRAPEAARLRLARRRRPARSGARRRPRPVRRRAGFPSAAARRRGRHRRGRAWPGAGSPRRSRAAAAAPACARRDQQELPLAHREVRAEPVPVAPAPATGTL